MKKISIITIAVLMLLSFCSCDYVPTIDTNDSSSRENHNSIDAESKTPNPETQSNIDSNPSTEEKTTNSVQKDEKTTNLTTDTIENNCSKHYEIDLNLDNYKTYLTYLSETTIISGGYHNDYTHKIQGVLSFAYYENVVVSFEITYKNSSETYHGIYNISLDAAGNAEFYANSSDLLTSINGRYNRSMERTYTIKGVSGKVIFNI